MGTHEYRETHGVYELASGSDYLDVRKVADELLDDGKHFLCRVVALIEHCAVDRETPLSRVSMSTARVGRLCGLVQLRLALKLSNLSGCVLDCRSEIKLEGRHW